MKKGQISVIIPTLNSKAHLERLFISLDQQTYKNFEVIINDDKRTTDNTKIFSLQYKKKFPVKYIQKNIVTAYGRKMGAEAANGEYLLHLDADMKLPGGLLKSCIEVVEKDQCDGLVIPELPYGGEGFWTKVKSFERSLYIGDESIECARFARTSAYNAIGGHNVKMTFGEDKDFDIRMRNAGYKICRISTGILHNEGNLTLQKAIKKKFYYGITANVLFSTHPEYFLLYANTILRPAFFRNWRKILDNPWLSICMIFLKLLESMAGLSGLLYARTPLARGDLKAKWR